MDVTAVNNSPLPTPEHMLGKGSLMPFNTVNSGVRKLMFGTNLEQRLPLISPDVPYVQTGYEAQFGEYSSSFERAKKGYTVVAKIPKFSDKPYSNFYLLLLDETGMELSVIHRTSYKHITESFGYIYNNDTIDFLTVGSEIKEGGILHKSAAFDQFNNRMDGKNLLIQFNASERTMEDGIIISQSCAEKLASPLIHKVNIMINDNDIPLNMYGDMSKYKIFPDIGEDIRDGIFCALRKEKKEEALYSQSFARLMEPTVSDEKITVSGKVIDIDVYCNNPEGLLSSPYSMQIAGYYQDHIRFCQEIVNAVDQFLRDGVVMDYELQKLYANCSGELEGRQFFNERAFANLSLEVTVMETIPVEVGDKLTNRYGGKGVVSAVKPDYMMPKTYNGEFIDIQANMCGVYGRENAGQLFEMSCTFIAKNIAYAMMDDSITTEQCVQMYLNFLEIVSPSMYDEAAKVLSAMSDEDVSFYMSTIATEGIIYLDIDPASEVMTLDKLAQLYDRFPWIGQEHMQVPIVGSNGNIRYVNSRRPMVYGYVYYYRLKQHGKEKFSVTSLSATNIKNENSRNKASKAYKAKFSRTPIRFGDMEMGNLTHIGSDIVIQMLMLYSASPHGRMLCEKMMTGDPFKVDVQLDSEAKNRNAEILSTYLKTIGLKLRFKKKMKKKNHGVLFHPVRFEAPRLFKPVKFYHKDEKVNPEDIERGKKNYKYPVSISPVSFDKPVEEISSEDYTKKDEDKDAIQKS